VVDGPASATTAAGAGAGARAGDAALDHKTVGTLYLVVALAFLLTSGVLGVLLRAQLAGPDGDLLTVNQYSEAFSYHGLFGVFFFLVPAVLGLATAVVPLQIGATRLAFPRLQAMALWLTVIGGGMVAAAPFLDGGSKVVSGWTLGSPLPLGPGFGGEAVDLVILGVGLSLVAAVAASVNLVVTVAKLRAPGVTLARLPLFSWAVTVMASVFVVALGVLLAALVMLFVDRNLGGQLLAGASEPPGSTLWPTLFWFGAYPMLWGLLVAALGIVSEIVPVFARARIADHGRAMAALGATGTLAFFGWPSEVVGLSDGRWLFVAGALVVLLPVLSVVVNWLLTLASGRRHPRPGPRTPAVPAILAVGFSLALGLGLLAGAASALDAAGDLHVNAFATGTQHGLFFLPVTLALVAGLHFWGPKLWGRRLSVGAGRLEALLLVGGGLLLTASLLVLGLQDMPLHVATYASGEGWQAAGVAAAVGGAAFGLGAVVVVLDVVGALAGRPAPVGRDPWGGHTLEWTTTSPPPPHNFTVLPLVVSATPALDLREAAGGAGTGEDGS